MSNGYSIGLHSEKIKIPEALYRYRIVVRFESASNIDFLHLKNTLQICYDYMNQCLYFYVVYLVKKLFRDIAFIIYVILKIILYVLFLSVISLLFWVYA